MSKSYKANDYETKQSVKAKQKQMKQQREAKAMLRGC